GDRQHPEGDRRADRTANGGQVPGPARRPLGPDAQAGMKTGEQARTAAPLVARRATDIDVSVLVPSKDEAENLPLFMQLAAAAFAGCPAVRFRDVEAADCA